MTHKVEFHHGMGDKLAYACRLLRKALRAGSTAVVTADEATLKTLDRQLWVFDEQEFVPHVLALPGKPVPERQHATPIWLTTEPADVPGERAVLINLGDELLPALTRYARMFEVVSNAPEDRQRGRQRWKAYQAQGWTVQPHEVKE
jgi:DNA polymerase III subunit chi